MSMKNQTIALLVFFSLQGIAQDNLPTNKRPKEFIYIIDSVKINPGIYFKCFDFSDVFNIKVNEQDTKIVISGSFTDPALFSKLVQSKLLSLNEITNTNLGEFNRTNPILYILNDKLLTDTTGVRIPAMCLTKVTVLKASETAYFKIALPNVLLLMISTKPIVSRNRKIMIRGLASN